MVSKMTSTSTGARPGKGRSGNSRLGFPFCISLASVGGWLRGRARSNGPSQLPGDDLAMIVSLLPDQQTADGFRDVPLET
jgi:hypothetical protein